MIPFALDEGLLDETPAIRLFTAAQMSQVTGTFTFSREGVTKWIGFNKGKVTGSRSSQLNESLGRLLVAWGWITHEAYVASLERMDTGKEKHGQILASMGALDQNRIPEALRKQHMVRLADAVSWTAGRYRFSSGENPATEEFPLWPIFQEGIFKRYGRAGLEQQAARLKGAAPKRLGGMFEPFLYSAPDALKLYDRFDGKKTLSDFAKNEPNQLVFLASVLTLLELGIIEMGQAPAEDPLEKAYKQARQLAPADLLRLAPNATLDEIHAAMGHMLNRFPAEKYGDSRYFQPLVSLIEEAARRLSHTQKEAIKSSEAVSPQAERSFQMGKDFLAKRQLAFALKHFEEAVHFAPQVPEMRGYLAWARFMENPADEPRRYQAIEVLEGAIAADADDADLQAFLGALLKLSGRLVEAESALLRALDLQPDHPIAKRELESVKMRLGRNVDRNAVNVAAIRGDARIVIQRWNGGNAIIHNFDKDEVRIGSSPKDDLTLSEELHPQLTTAHCAILRQKDILFVRRIGHLGVVLVNGRLLQPREDVHVTAEDRITLGSPQIDSRVIELRVLDDLFLQELRRHADKYRKGGGGDNIEWVG